MGLHIAAQGLHMAAQGLRMAAQGLHMAAQWLQMHHIAVYAVYMAAGWLLQDPGNTPGLGSLACSWATLLHPDG